MSDAVARDSYVTQETWLQPSGRPEAIDEIADQFERPAAVVALAAVPDADTAAAVVAAAVVADAAGGWPSRSSGWRSVGRLHPDVPQRRVS